MRIAIVGTGVSGLVAARSLSQLHCITVFEADSRLGGHVNTVRVDVNGEQHDIDTGFIVCNDRTYPNFNRLLVDLDVSIVPTEMSFSVRCEQEGLEYNGSSLNGLFSQRSNLLRPSFYKMLREILKFNKQGAIDLHTAPERQTVSEYLHNNNYSLEFANHYLLPMGAAIWSCPYSEFEQFPIRFILEFYVNHGLLSLKDRPQWHVVRGGSQSYIQKLIVPFRDNIRLNCPVHSVVRHADSVIVTHANGTEQFDEIVFACHSDQALAIIDDADELETSLLKAFPYSSSTAILHTDISVLPRRKRAWASWNYLVRGERDARPTLTYNMNILQHIQSENTYCVTLNAEDLIDPNQVIAKFNYSHPLFTANRATAQRRHQEIIRHRRTSFCGAYWRNSFHEDGVVSAMAVCKKFDIDDWTSGGNVAGISQPEAVNV